MQPVMYSTVRARQERIGWGRAGHAIKYFKTDIRRYVLTKGGSAIPSLCVLLGKTQGRSLSTTR